MDVYILLWEMYVLTMGIIQINDIITHDLRQMLFVI